MWKFYRSRRNRAREDYAAQHFSAQAFASEDSEFGIRAIRSTENLNDNPEADVLNQRFSTEVGVPPAILRRSMIAAKKDSESTIASDMENGQPNPTYSQNAGSAGSSQPLLGSN